MTQQAARKALGRGLSSLLDDMDENAMPPIATPGAAQTVAVDLLRTNADQPRKYFDEKALDELADSIKKRGVVQPILVRPLAEEPGAFEIVAGERRWRAAQRAKLHEVPVVIREMDDAGAMEVAIIENVQRNDLNPMEEAFAYRALMDRFGYTQETLAKNIGKSRPHIANLLRLVNLPEAVQGMMRTGEISAGHGKALLGSAQPEALAKKIVQKGMSVREAERAAKRLDSIAPEASSGPKKDAETRLLEGEIGAALRMPVSINHKGKEGGEVVISYRSLEDLEDLARFLKGEAQPVLAGDG